MDLWFLDQKGYDDHAAYSRDLIQRLTPETSATILTIKEAYWRRPEYRDWITSALIYRAVLDHGIKHVAEFERFAENYQHKQS